jgi:hypothetical protein
MDDYETRIRELLLRARDLEQEAEGLKRPGLFHVRLRRVAAGPQLTEWKSSPIVN